MSNPCSLMSCASLATRAFLPGRAVLMRVFLRLLRQRTRRRNCAKKSFKWWIRFGLVEVRDSVWRDLSSSYVRLLAPAIGMKFKQCSKPLERVVSDFGFESSFQKSVERIREHYGFAPPLSAVAGVTRKHAAIMARTGALSVPEMPMRFHPKVPPK